MFSQGDCETLVIEGRVLSSIISLSPPTSPSAEPRPSVPEESTRYVLYSAQLNGEPS